MFVNENGRLLRTLYGETLCIEPWGENSLRVRATRERAFSGEDWALLPQNAGVPCQIDITPEQATITNGKLTARVLQNGKLSFYNRRGALLLEEYVRNRENLYEYCSPLNIPARELKPLPGGWKLTARFEACDGERIYGMGQYQHGNLNHKGCTLELAQRNTQASVPFALSSAGYGLLWNNPAVGSVVFGKNKTEWTAECTRELDYWITAGDTPSELVERYADVTGKVPMMPDYGMGFWQSKLRYQTQRELLEVAREHKRRGLPMDVIVIDFFHWTNHGDWRFDPDYWPNPDEMVRELRELGIEVMVSVWPTVAKDSESYPDMSKHDLLVKTDRGQSTHMEFLGNNVFFDATNPKARDYIWRKIKRNYYDKGIKLFWLDEAEPEYGPYDFDIYRYHLGPALLVSNLYPALYAKAFYDGMTAAGQQNVINLVRCAWAGSQRYGALVWSGDVDSSFRGLREQFAAGLNMGLAGIPWWTTDIGGFLGGNPDDPQFRECIVRWFEYAAFCPVFRLHGERLPHQKPLSTSGGGQFFSGAANEVWSYGEEAYGIFTKYLLLRERLRPYIARQMKAAHECGTPVIRPLFYDFPDDPAAWEVTDAYLFGPSLLIAPVMTENVRERAVYLPAGTPWRCARTGEVYAGGQTIVCAAPLDAIPVFINGKCPVELSI